MSNQSDVWRPDQQLNGAAVTNNAIYKPDVFESISTSIDSLDSSLRELSLDIHKHPELAWKEFHAHDVLTDYMEREGFEVTRKYKLETAWVAKFTHKQGGRTIGINSEMDALPGVGHACGHNLIAIAGVAVACALKSALEKHDIPGNIVLLGTPAEEGAMGKVKLMDAGAYEGMDVCLMCHPAPGPPNSANLSSSLALQRLMVEYTGHTAHAALSPWEAQNALDAAVSAYTNIALLRQQVKPSHRIHGIIEGRDWATNIIPDYAKMLYYVRAPTWKQVQLAVPRVTACFDAAGLATACSTKVQNVGEAFDLRQNKALGDEFAHVYESKFGPVDYIWGIASASTDFGHVTYALPSIHPCFGIPTVINGGNHTRDFTDSAALPESHKACLNVAKALAAVGVRVLTDDAYFSQVRETFETDKRVREMEA